MVGPWSKFNRSVETTCSQQEQGRKLDVRLEEATNGKMDEELIVSVGNSPVSQHIIPVASRARRQSYFLETFSIGRPGVSGITESSSPLLTSHHPPEEQVLYTY